MLGYSATDGDVIPFDIEIIVGDPSGTIAPSPPPHLFFCVI